MYGDQLGEFVCGYWGLNNYLFRYGANELESVKSYKYLGLIMSPYGNFNLARQELKKVSLKALYKLRKETLLCEWRVGD